MAGYTVIADVSKTVLQVLRRNIVERDLGDLVDTDQIVLASPADISDDSDVRLSLFLYNVSKDPHLSNVPSQQIGENTYQDPPLALNLQYLLTAYPSTDDDQVVRVHEQHQLLGLAMQIFHDNARIQGDSLHGSLHTEEALSLSLQPEADADLETVWSLIEDTPLEPSVAYEAGPITIDSLGTETVDRVSERDISVNRTE